MSERCELVIVTVLRREATERSLAHRPSAFVSSFVAVVRQ